VPSSSRSSPRRRATQADADGRSLPNELLETTTLRARRQVVRPACGWLLRYGGPESRFIARSCRTPSTSCCTGTVLAGRPLPVEQTEISRLRRLRAGRVALLRDAPEQGDRAGQAVQEDGKTGGAHRSCQRRAQRLDGHPLETCSRSGGGNDRCRGDGSSRLPRLWRLPDRALAETQHPA